MMPIRFARPFMVATTVLFASMGCRKSEVNEGAGGTTSTRVGDGTPPAAFVGDTDVIRGPGMPTAPDDTLGTRYGKHEGPRRILPAPECLPMGFALCVKDTARTVHTDAGLGVEGGFPDERVTQWLIFAAARDSLQVFIVGPQMSYLWMSPPSAAGFVAEQAISDASWIRARFGHAGTYVFSVTITSDTAIVYDLRVARVLTTGASHPTGGSATVTIEGDSSANVAIAPAAMAGAIGSDSAWKQFAVPPGTYRVLLVRDTAYVACQIPCRNLRPLSLFPNKSATVRP
jgi:hypothetical protein